MHFLDTFSCDTQGQDVCDRTSHVPDRAGVLLPVPYRLTSGVKKSQKSMGMICGQKCPRTLLAQREENLGD